MDKKIGAWILAILAAVLLIGDIIFNFVAVEKGTGLIFTEFIGCAVMLVFAIVTVICIIQERIKIKKSTAVLLACGLLLLAIVFAISPVRDLINGPIEKDVRVVKKEEYTPMQWLWLTEYSIDVVDEYGESYTLKLSHNHYDSVKMGDKITVSFYEKTKILKDCNK